MTPREPIADAGAAPAVRPDDTCDRSPTTGQDHCPLDPAATTDGAASEHPAEIGRYSIRRLLGSGAMGAVYLAHDPELDRAVALKVPRLTGPEAQERFLREARAAAAVSHPNLCPVHDAGRADGGLYLAMAYVPGSTLTELLRESGPLPPARAAAIATGVARGMAEAHRHGIIHRDLKPGNILMNPRGEPVVTDFGLARRSGTADLGTDPGTTFAHDPRLTQAGIVMGTPAYMPPEQARGDLDRVGPISDVYALGAILFEMLTGEPPFRAPTVPELLRRLETQPAPVPSASNAAVPAGLDAVCAKALAKQPDERFESMEAFAAALAPFAGGVRRRKWGRIAAAAAAFVLLLVAGVILYVKTDNGTIEVRLNDPNADVQVTVDGEEVTLTEDGRVTKLRAGPHMLTVKGPNYETETKLFKVTRGDKSVVEVELKPKAAVAVAAPKGVQKPIPEAVPAPPSVKSPALTADRLRLAQLLAQGRKQFDEGRFGTLGSIAEEALALDPESPNAIGLRAAFRRARGDIVGALADCEAALKLNPDTFVPLIVRCMILGGRGKFDDVVADANVAIRLVPSHPLPWFIRGQAYMELFEDRQAFADSSQALELGYRGPDAILNRGTSLVALGQYDEAMADFDRAAKQAPMYSLGFARRSALHAKLGNEKEAAADWARAKMLDPSLDDAARLMVPDPPEQVERKKLTPDEATALANSLMEAETAFGESRLADSRAAAEEALKIDPTSARVHAIRARLYGEAKQLDSALKAAKEAIRLDPNNAWAYTVRGTVKNARKDYAGAIADHTIAIRIDPKNYSAWNNRGWAYSERRQNHQAVADMSEALRLKPDYAPSLANRGMCHLYLGDYQKALDDYTTAATLQPHIGRWLLICSLIRAKLGDVQGAARDRARSLEIEPALKDARIALPPVLPPPKLDPVLPTEERGAARSPEQLRLAGLLARGEQLIELQRFRDLDAVVNQALEIDAESPGALALRANLRHHKDDFAGARADADAALKLNPETFRGLLVLSLLFGEEGKWDECIAVETIAIRLRPSHPWAWSNRAQSFLQKKEYRQAIFDATQAVNLGFRHPSALTTRGVARAFLGEYDAALADLDAAAKLAPNDYRAFDERAMVHAKMGNRNKAEADWKRAEELNPELKPEDRGSLPDPPKPPQRKMITTTEVDAFNLAMKEGEVAIQSSRFTDSLTAVDEALQIDPTSARAHSLRGRVLAQTGKFTQARAEADEAIRLDPTDAWAYVIRGGAKFNQKDSAGAIADHTIGITLDAKNASAWYNRSRGYSRREQYHQVLADLNESIRLRADSDFYASRGACYLRFGEYENALSDYVRATELEPKNGRWLMACWRIREKRGDRPGAERDRIRALELDPKLKNAPFTLPPVLPPVKRDPELPE